MPRLIDVPDNPRSIPQYSYPLTFSAVNDDDDASVGVARPMRADASAAIKQSITEGLDDVTVATPLNVADSVVTLFAIEIPNPRRVTLSGQLLIRYKMTYSAGTYVGAPSARMNLVINAPASMAQTVNGPVRVCADEAVVGLFRVGLVNALIGDDEDWGMTFQYEVTAAGNAGDKTTITFHIDPATSGNELLAEFMVEGD